MSQTKRIRLSALSFVLIVALIALVGVFAIGTTKPAETAYADWSGEGSGTATDPYLIGTKEQLETYRDIVNGINGETRNPAACARLTADIDLEGSESNQWVPIGTDSYNARFQGIFDGAGHTISGLYINQPNKSCIGLFGCAKNATIKKVTVQGSITGCRRIGGIVGDIYGDSNGSRCTIYKCTNECTIYSTLVGNADATASNQTGGIVGYVYQAGTVVSACVNKGNVSSAVRTTAYQSGNSSYTFHEAYVAGIVGFSICGAITIKNCVNEGNISSATGVAGIVAYATGAGSVITGCFNKGNLTSNPLSSNCKCGGIAGNGYADITYCGNEGNITANGSGVAGIVAFVYGADYEVTCCYNTGNITGGTGSVAGITPSNSYVPVTNCYNTGDITITSATSGGYGGIVNSIYQSTVSYVFNTGRLIETTSYKYNSRGSVASEGGNGASIHHAYFLNTSYNKGIGWRYGESGPASGCSSTALTAAQMRNQSNFAGWDFTNVWIMDNDAGHPVLRHVHDYCCDADEDTDTITVTCERPYGNAKCYCENAGEEYTLTLIHPTLEQERCGGNAEATFDADELAVFNAGTGLNVSSNNITYEKREGSSVTSLGTTAPTTYGDYTVKLTVNGVFVSYDYTIQKLELVFEKEVLLNNEPSTTTVSNLNGETAATLLDEEEVERYLQGEDVSVYLQVTTDEAALNIPKSDKAKAREYLSEGEVKEGSFIDLSLFKKVGDNDATAVHESETSFDVTIDIPAHLAQPYGCVRTYSIIRIHDGVAETLESTVSDGKISFSTDKFSTYLIAYTDTFDPDGEYIEFTVDVEGENTRYIDSNSIGEKVTITYKITHNDGFNTILLIPEYNTDVFEIANNSDITISDALGDAMITEETSPRTLPLKIELGATGDKYVTLDKDLGENVFFLTIKYTIKAAVEGDFAFSLVLASQGENTSSEAYYIVNDEQKGEQNRIPIRVVMEEPLTLLVKEQPVITIGYNNNTNHYIFEYGKAAVSTDKVGELIPGDNSLEPADPADLTVYYTFKDASGNEVAESDLPTITPSWFYYYNNNWTALNTEPMLPGTYKVVISSAAEGEYYAAEDKYAYVEIVPRVIYVDVNDATSTYGEPIADLTAGGVDETTGELTSTAICEEDAIYITLSTNATSESIPGGDYYIRGTVDTENSVGYSVENPYGSNELYSVRFRRVETQEVCDSVYTITKKQVTLTALDQFASYTGNEPEVDQTLYTLEGIESTGLTISITKASGVQGGDYDLTPSFETAPDATKYEIEYVKGTFTIGGANDDYFRQFFETHDWVYNGEDQIVIEGSNIPVWVTKVEIKALQVDDDFTEGTTLSKKNAGTYNFVVKLTLADVKYSSTNSTEVTISHDPDNEKPLTATISRAQVTLTAVDKEVYYGEGEHLPYVPEFSVEGTTEELDYSWAITNDNVAFTPAADTDVGDYPIVITEGSNPNFIVNVVNGIYKVKQAQATVTAGASDVYYNRGLDKTISGAVNTLSLTPTVTYYTDSECTEAVNGDPVNAGEYWVKAVVAGTDNYLGAEAVASFHILPVQLEGITFTYSHGNVTWTAIANDAGKTDADDEDEEGVDAAALKQDTEVTYYVYDGETLVATIAPEETRTFDAAAATTYKVVAVAFDNNNINNNYIRSEATMVAVYEVSFDEGDHAGNPNGQVNNLPATQYIFAGQTAVQPQTNPSVNSCTFSAWKVGDNSYAFNVPVNSDITVVAIWNATTYTITFKFLEESHTTSGENQDVFTIEGYIYGSAITYSVATIDPVKADSDNGGIYYTFANKWIYNETEYSITVSNGTATINGITVPQEDMTFIAVFDINYNSFTISYYLSSSTSTEEEDYQLIATQYASYGEVIFYREIETSDIAWFKIEGWFRDMARTADLYATMPAQDISVYSGYAFDIGTGDVNGDGDVNVEDITLYRQWIVGGYEMIVVEPGTEWATVNGEGFSLENTYFIKRVADNNKDESRDVRDVTVIRMSIVGGYSWDIVSDEVSGQSIARSASIYQAGAIVSGFNTYGRVRLYVNITDTDRDLTINTTKNVYIDLGGKTLTLKSLTIRTSGKGAKIVIENGTIVTTNDITIASANGQVIVDKVTGYAGGSINLQSSESGLYFEGANAFYSGSSTSVTPATVQVEEGSHVVINEGATLNVEKILATGSITFMNKTINSIVIEGPYIDISND